MTTLTSRRGSLSFGQGHPTLLINDQLRVMDQRPEVLEELKAGRIEGILELARRGHEVGMDMVDILVTHLDLSEADLVPKIAVAIHEELGCPISLDSRDPRALEMALEALQPYKVMINSITAEPESYEILLPLAAKYKAVVVGMPIGERHGLPKTVNGRIEETRVILEAAQDVGIPQEDLVIDAICLASSAEPDSFQTTLETLDVLSREMGLTTILGIGNAGFGMPTQTVIDLAYLVAAVPWGLHAALVDPETAGLVETVRAIDFLAGRDPYGARYISHYRETKKKKHA
jgi:5-methyltetrahydrofolate--homocysteine methyltransferase